MANRFEQYNEKTFEAYCKTSIDNAVLKERRRKTMRSQWEQSFSALPDELIASFVDKSADFEPEEYQVFIVRGKEISVYHSGLAQALSLLMPRDREIVLLYYFLDMNDEEIACHIGATRATVQRRRNRATNRLKQLLEDTL